MEMNIVENLASAAADAAEVVTSALEAGSHLQQKLTLAKLALAAANAAKGATLALEAGLVQSHTHLQQESPRPSSHFGPPPSSHFGVSPSQPSSQFGVLFSIEMNIAVKLASAAVDAAKGATIALKAGLAHTHLQQKLASAATDAAKGATLALELALEAGLAQPYTHLQQESSGPPSHFGPPPSSHFGPPPPSSHFEVPPSQPSSHFGVPPSQPSSHFGVPPSQPSSHFGPLLQHPVPPPYTSSPP